MSTKSDNYKQVELVFELIMYVNSNLREYQTFQNIKGCQANNPFYGITIIVKKFLKFCKRYNRDL